MKKPEEFFKKYHVAMARANRNNLDKIKPRMAADWIEEWMRQVGDKITDPEEFAAKFELFLTEGLGFADRSTVEITGDEMVIDVGGCMICPGNDILKRAGDDALCPITATGLKAISRVMDRKATLEGVNKEGKQVGYCEIRYRLEDK